ncbi:glycosyltransferase family 2 protein [Donghicola sp. XS_ASV15]|uniref:glycosyltransferase family 2 protein n=1 Tax=Donghicola sp. XS_ASV15 TaxID=3241295 RepID=UPI0035121E28
MTRWGIVATIKATAKEIMSFAAHHLELGADELHLYLDSPCPRADQALSGHPKVTLINTDTKYWRMRRPREEHQRPPMHQARQFANAKWAYMHNDVDWLFHIDVDEFLWADIDVRTQLAALPPEALCARIRPLEALSTEAQEFPDGQLPFKSAALEWDLRRRQTREIYPTYGDFLNGGFLSHLAGKMAVRTKQPDMMVRIHNVIQNGVHNPGEAELPDLTLCHLHAHTWDQWRKSLSYRRRKGSYRAELAPPVAPPGTKPDPDAPNLNRLFDEIEASGGEAALKAFYNEVCLATPELQSRLERFGHFHLRNLGLQAARIRQFGQDWG